MVLQQIRRSLVSSGQAKLRCQSVLHPTAFRALGVAADRSPEVLMTHFRDILNKNADSTKSLQELSNDWFQQATGEKKGLDSSELATLMERLGLQLRGGEKDAFFRYFDENNSGSVTYNEFTQAIRGAMPKFAASLAFMDQHRGHYPSAMLSVRSALPRFELSETDEWLESLDALLQHHGPRRARFLLQELTDEAVRRGVRMSSTITTPMINTIPATVEPEYPGDLNIEKRISNLVRWNAAVMVSDGNKRAPGVGGHIGTFASVCDIWEVGQQHFFRGKGAGGGMGDQIYLQGHAAPGAYARAYLEGRLSLEQIMNFRQEVGGKGISSYPHPRLMPDFWENPTVSMGIGPLQAVCQARFFRYLHLRGLADTSGSRVWCFIGD
jgi:hypothetical protein